MTRMSEEKLSSKNRIMVAILLVGAVLTVLNQTIISPALPVIMADLGAAASTAQWLTSGYSLVNAIIIPVTAYFMSRFTTKRLFIASMGFFFVGSAIAMWGPSFTFLLIGRLVQAVSAGMLIPMVMTVLLLIFPRSKRGFAMGLYNLVICAAPAIGPVASGAMTDTIG